VARKCLKMLTFQAAEGGENRISTAESAVIAVYASSRIRAENLDK
jgi:hypothetical protein